MVWLAQCRFSSQVSCKKDHSHSLSRDFYLVFVPLLFFDPFPALISWTIISVLIIFIFVKFFQWRMGFDGRLGWIPVDAWYGSHFLAVPGRLSIRWWTNTDKWIPFNPRSRICHLNLSLNEPRNHWKKFRLDKHIHAVINVITLKRWSNQ